MIEIDGSEGEGGGQMLRTALGLSALTGKAFEFHNIRSRRERPGLAAQHLTGVRGVTEICNAMVEGADLGSTELTFEPQSVESGEYRFDVGTAGSITLVLQACMLACAGSRTLTELDIIGGTNVRMSPPVDYLENVLFPMLRNMGYHVDIDVRARGFYPQGGGEVVVRMARGDVVAPLVLTDRGRFVGVNGTCFTRKLPDHITERMASTARKELVDRLPVKLRMDRGDGHSIGAGIFLWAEYQNTMLGSDALGEKGVSSEKLGEIASRNLGTEMDGCGTLDLHAADQLLPYLAMAAGPSEFLVRDLSSHFETQVEIVRRFLDVDIELVRDEAPYRVRVTPNRT